MKQETAVEWLVDTIFNDLDFKDSILKLAINLAKEMERQQIINAYVDGAGKGEMFNNENRAFTTDAEEYYNEKFKSE